jgi:hypothetical protein
MRSWPSPGNAATFRCEACEQAIQAVYEPGGHLTCGSCGRVLAMPPLPPGHPERSIA